MACLSQTQASQQVVGLIAIDGNLSEEESCFLAAAGNPAPSFSALAESSYFGMNPVSNYSLNSRLRQVIA